MRRPHPRADVTVTPEGWLHRGDCFVRGDGVQLAVFGAIPGERARVRLVGHKQHQDIGKFIAPAGPPHPERVTPPCDRFAPCGRCPLMHITPAAQARVQRLLVDEALAEFGVDARCEPVRGSDRGDVLHQLGLVAGFSDRKSMRIGVRGHDGRDVTAIPECLVVTPGIRELMSAAAFHLRELEVWPWDGRSGTLRALLLRQSPADGALQLTLVTARANHVLGELANRLASQLSLLSGVVVHINEERPDGFHRDEEGGVGLSVVYGNVLLDLVEEDVRLRLSPADPFPVHPAMTRLVHDDVLAMLAPQQGDAVVELSPGNGMLTMRAARRSGWALGVGEAEVPSRHARDNASANSVAAEFLAGTVEDALAAAAPRLHGRRPLAIARAGTRGLSSAAIQNLLASSPRRVVLLSSNPKAIARNAAALVAGGLVAERVVAWDVAPNTPFVEIGVLLTSPDRSPPVARAPRRRTVR